MANDQNFTVVVGTTVTAGVGGNNPVNGATFFDVNDSAGFFMTRPSSVPYTVIATLAGISAGVVALDIVSRTVHGFTVQLTSPLTTGDTLQFKVYDSDVGPAGRLLAIQTLTSTVAATYTPTVGTKAVHVRMIGGGGGGGGASAGAGVVSMAAGGGSGAYLDFWITGSGLITGGTYQCGGPGQGGAGGGGGGTGGDTTLTINGTVYTAKGGSGGDGGTQNGALGFAIGGGFQGGSTIVAGGVMGGWWGANGGIYNTSFGGEGYAGQGAGSPFGIGGAQGGLSQGGAALGFGAGGGGAGAVNAINSGGVATQGYIVIEESG